ncbi:TetR/AcrR family transcriptional regulator [Xylophilus sp. GW821-FHT01B05]
MTRVRADDYDDKKQSILDRAATLFARKGFELTTMVEVATACGTSKSHLYHYFPGKEDLLFEIVREHITGQAAELAGIVGLPLPAEERFRRYVSAFVERAAHSRDEHLVLVNDLKFLPLAQRRQVRKLETQLVDLMIGLLKEINPSLMLPDKVQAPYAMLLFGMIIWTFTWYRKSGAISPKELAERISQLFVYGFKDSEFSTKA